MSGRGRRVPFRVLSATSEDPEHPSAELNEQTPDTRGWHSQANCRFPQEVVIQFAQPINLSQLQVLSHEFLIATRIELFVVDPSRGANDWQRLGHFSLSPNEKSSYQARELKSVQLSGGCSSLMLRLLDVHRNPLNPYNQVAIVLLSVFGEITTSPLPPVPANAYGAPISGGGLQMLANDLGCDQETASRIRDLTMQKEAAVAKEDYDTAKKCKLQITELQKLAAQIADLEAQKKKAVEDEDYDTAKVLKGRIDMLRPGTPREPTPVPPVPPVVIAPRQQTPPAYVPPSPIIPPPDSPGNYSQHSVHELPYETYEEAGELPPSPTRAMFPPALEPDPEESPIRPVVPEVEQWPTVEPDRPGSRQLNVGLNSSRSHNPTDVGVELGGMTEQAPPVSELPEPEPLSGNDATKAEDVVPVFGDMVARHLFSKDRTLREKGLEMVVQHLDEQTGNVDDTVLATSALLVHALQDKTPPVVMQSFPVIERCIQLMQQARTAPAHLKTVTQLLVDRTAESNKRIAEAAQESLVSMGRVSGTRSIVCSTVSKPLAKKTPAHLAARLQLLAEVVPVLGVGEQQGELEIETVMQLVLDGFLSPNERCRDASLKLTLEIAHELGDNDQVMSYLADHIKPQQLTLLERSLPDNQVVVENASPRDPPKEQFPANSPPVNVRRSTEGAIPINSPRNEAERAIMNKSLGTSLKRHSQFAANAKQNSPGANPAEADQLLSPGTESGMQSFGDEDFPSDMCQFCGLQDANFTEDTLDFHFWQDCPMLCSCAECGQVIEIMCLVEHLLGECDARDKFDECPTCSEAIKKTEMPAHTAAGCNPAQHELNRCPLCHQNFGDGEEGWRDHLLGAAGCPSNPRTNNKASAQ